MQIEPAGLQDARAIAKVHVASWQQAYREILPAAFLAGLSIEKRESMWRESILKGVPEVLVARIQDSLAGFIAYGPCRDEGAPSSTSEIWAIYLSPAVWSSGIGRALWLAGRQRLVGQGMSSVSLWVFSANSRAIRFYRSAGFLPDTSPAKEFTLGGVQVQEARYVQALGA